MNQLITSFVIRCHVMDSQQRDYRIKLTHVQGENELSFDSFEEAMNYMKETVDGLESTLKEGRK
ncbi:hypothetical protein D3H55_21815 [Bacillus salacetis]|uniref:Uncharacterized protein n=1 Tax=Bacillus salacetis TaxID=2315464 RepID=A0A3A1QRS0_9BACI|nr:hypothetical protein [Bacillus salacetis]RIW28434.1 hypothetical protein D3H55_21815 [Bacillus salacetis]